MKIEKKYYHKINNLDLELSETNHKYLMINQWSPDYSHKYGIASFMLDEDEDYWYVRTYGEFSHLVDPYDFACLVNLGYKWIKDGCFNE